MRLVNPLSVQDLGPISCIVDTSIKWRLLDTELNETKWERSQNHSNSANSVFMNEKHPILSRSN